MWLSGMFHISTESQVAGIRMQLLGEEMMDPVITITIAIVYELLHGGKTGTVVVRYATAGFAEETLQSGLRG